MLKEGLWSCVTDERRVTTRSIVQLAHTRKEISDFVGEGLGLPWSCWNLGSWEKTL